MIITKSKLFLLIVSCLSTLTLAEVIAAKFFPQPTLTAIQAGYPNCYAPADFLPFTLKLALSILPIKTALAM